MRSAPPAHEYYGLSQSEAGAPAVTLATARTIQQLLDLDVHQAITVWAEWGPTFIPPLDKGTENRPGKPPKTILGKRVAFHNGTYLGGRKGKKAREKAFAAVLSAAEMSGWRVVDDDKVDRSPGWFVIPKPGVSEVNLVKGYKVVPYNIDKIPLGAITFTAIITGYEEPTETPTRLWQYGSDMENPDDRSYGWHVEHVVPLMTPIPCAGIQGFWPLSRLLKYDEIT